jgi:hypothetical protein
VTRGGAARGKAWVGSGGRTIRRQRPVCLSASQSHGTITLELKRARGEGCVGRVCQGGSKGLRRDGRGEGGVLADRERSLGKRGDGEVVSRVTRGRGHWWRRQTRQQWMWHVLSGANRTGEERGQSIGAHRVHVPGAAGRSSPPPPACNGGRQFALGTGAEGHRKEGWSRRAEKGGEGHVGRGLARAPRGTPKEASCHRRPGRSSRGAVGTTVRPVRKRGLTRGGS